MVRSESTSGDRLLARGAAQVPVRKIGAATAIAVARLSHKDSTQERIVENIKKQAYKLLPKNTMYSNKVPEISRICPRQQIH